MEYAETLAETSQAENHEPADARSFAQRGECHRQRGSYAEALADFDRAIELRPNYPWAIARRAETFRLMGCYERALADFDCAIERMPDYAWALAHRGAAYWQIGCHQEALADLNWAIVLTPDYAWALVYRTDIYISMRQYEEALANADRAIALDETIVSHWRGERGLILNFLGRYAETIACCEQALQQNPHDYIALYSLVVALVSRQGWAANQAMINKTRLLLQGVEGAPRTRAAALYRLGGLAALQGKHDQALCHLQAATLLDEEPGEIARHDPAWDNLREDGRFQKLTAAKPAK
ncbi:MAG TPA: tetratricopeptide repeat protein [Caldilineaceae bacterium]|nr:tetratricopeptide repeat protein [Caldilineaceae bacterium]